jgi:adenosylcobyric acid synthase
MAGDKSLHRTRGMWLASEQQVTGYEIHMGVTERPEHVDAACQVSERDGEACDEPEGAAGHDDRVWGTYLHGLFDAPGFRLNLLASLRPDLLGRIEAARAETHAAKDAQYDALAAHFRECLDLDALRGIMGIG